MRKFRVLIVLIAICLLSLTLSGCGIFGGGGGGGGGNQKPKSVTVTLDPNGGTVEKLTIIGEAGSAMDLTAPVRDGYTFDAWYNGWNVISNTVFPDNDTTLTARYYADEDTERTVSSIQTELNKVYDVSFSWGQSHFTPADWQGIEYLKKNITTEIDVTATMEKQASTSFGGSVWFILTGADKADVISTSPKMAKNDTYVDFSIGGTTTAKVLVGSSSTIIMLRKDADLGSQYLRYRNLILSITYIEKSGTLV